MCEYLGINGVWWSITTTTVIGGIIMCILYFKMKNNGTLYTNMPADGLGVTESEV